MSVVQQVRARLLFPLCRIAGHTCSSPFSLLSAHLFVALPNQIKAYKLGGFPEVRGQIYVYYQEIFYICGHILSSFISNVRTK